MEGRTRHFSTLVNREVEEVSLYDYTPESDSIEYIAIKFKDFNNGKTYNEVDSTYIVSTDNKWFKPYLIGNSIFGNCANGQDMGVRIDWYLGEWKIDYCYKITKDEVESIFKREEM